MIAIWSGCPKQLWIDIGPELISQPFDSWINEHQIMLAYIEPGKPTQNAYIKRLNRTFRESVLNDFLFRSTQEVGGIAEEWFAEYNAIRPYDVMDGMPRYKYAIQHA